MTPGDDDLELGQDRVVGIGEQLDLSEDTIDSAEGIAARADMDYPINRGAASVAAGAIYLAAAEANEKRIQSEVADAADVSEASLRSAFHEICRHELDHDPSQRHSDVDSDEQRGKQSRKWLRTAVRLAIALAPVGVVLPIVLEAQTAALVNLEEPYVIGPPGFVFDPFAELAPVVLLVALVWAGLPYLPGYARGGRR